MPLVKPFTHLPTSFKDYSYHSPIYMFCCMEQTEPSKRPFLSSRSPALRSSITVSLAFQSIPHYFPDKSVHLPHHHPLQLSPGPYSNNYLLSFLYLPFNWLTSLTQISSEWSLLITPASSLPAHSSTHCTLPLALTFGFPKDTNNPYQPNPLEAFQSLPDLTSWMCLTVDESFLLVLLLWHAQH